MGWQARRAAPAETGRILKVSPSRGWKAARTRTLESVRYVAQPFQAAGLRSFPAPQRAPDRVGPWWECQDAPVRAPVSAFLESVLGLFHWVLSLALAVSLSAQT